MNFSFRCPSCNAEREASKKIVGRRVRCPECGHVSRVEEPRTAQPADEEDFDAYYHWLAIPAGEQPPNYYRLLGVSLFEPDVDVIAISADRQMVHVKAQATGRFSRVSQKLLNELAKARSCLLDPRKRYEYDDALRAELAAKAPVTRAATPERTEVEGKAKSQSAPARTNDKSSSTPVASIPATSAPARGKAAAPERSAEKLVPTPSLTPLVPLEAATPSAPPAAPQSQWKLAPAALADEPDETSQDDDGPIRPKERKPYESELDMTPMVDMTFLLLIFFMVTASFAIQKVMQLPPPRSDEVSTQTVADPEDNPDYVQVLIDEFNTYHVSTPEWEEDAPSEHEMLQLVRKARDGSQEGKVPNKLLVTAHADALYEKVIRALDAGATVGMEQLSLAMTEEGLE